MIWDWLVQRTGKYCSIRRIEYPEFQIGIFGRMESAPKFLLMATSYVQVCTTNLQILTVICCIHRHIHHMSRTQFHILDFLDFDVYAANQKSEEMCQFSKNVVILSLWSKRATIAPNNLIDSQHHKRHKKIRMTEFHSPSLSIVIITQSKVSFLIILNYSRMIPRVVESFLSLLLFHSNATKT